jgi:hypothetical protein
MQLSELANDFPVTLTMQTGLYLCSMCIVKKIFESSASFLNRDGAAPAVSGFPHLKRGLDRWFIGTQKVPNH